MPYETRIQVLIQEETPYGQFNDALYFTQEEFATKTNAEIESAIQERVDNFINVIENPVEPEIVPNPNE